MRDLALAYGVPVWAAHRALTDCIYIAQVFEREAQLEALLQQALLPRKLYRARLAYDQRHLAKEAGFRWNEGVQGAWSKLLTEAERGLLPFEVLPAEGNGARICRSRPDRTLFSLFMKTIWTFRPCWVPVDML